MRVRVSPGSGKTGFTSLMDDGCYKIRLKSKPVEGKANLELLRWLAKEFSVSRGSVTILSGQTSRIKTVKIGEPAVKPHWYND